MKSSLREKVKRNKSKRANYAKDEEERDFHTRNEDGEGEEEDGERKERREEDGRERQTERVSLVGVLLVSVNVEADHTVKLQFNYGRNVILKLTIFIFIAGDRHN